MYNTFIRLGVEQIYVYLHFWNGCKSELEPTISVHRELLLAVASVVADGNHYPFVVTNTFVMLLCRSAELQLFSSSPGIKPFQCDRCGKKFTRAYSLKMHRLKHEGKRCFRCQICSATFTSFGEYKHHMRVSRHIIRKPRIYECKTCGAMFTNSGNLIVHLRSLNHEASELANYFQSRWGVRGRWPPSFTQISPGVSLDSNTWGSFDPFSFHDFGLIV